MLGGSTFSFGPNQLTEWVCSVSAARAPARRQPRPRDGEQPCRAFGHAGADTLLPEECPREAVPRRHAGLTAMGAPEAR